MKTRQLIALLMLCTTFGIHAQYKKTFNHYYEQNLRFGNFVIETHDGAIDALRVTRTNGDKLMIQTNSIDILGELKSTSKFEFTIPESIEGQPFISGAFDQGTNRIVIYELFKANENRIIALKYNRLTGAVVQSQLCNQKFKTDYIKALRHDNEIVKYSIIENQGLSRVAFNSENLSEVTEELVDSTITYIGGVGRVSAYSQDAGVVKLVNGKEVGSFNSGLKTLYVRPEKGTYIQLSLSSENAGTINMVYLPNGNLLVANGADFFLMNSQFEVIKTKTIDLGGNSSNKWKMSELGVVSGKIIHFTRRNGEKYAKQRFYDLNLELLEESDFSYEPWCSDLVPLKNGLLLIGTVSDEYQSREKEYDPFVVQVNTPLYLEYFTKKPSIEQYHEFRHKLNTESLKVDAGLGEQFVPVAKEGMHGAGTKDSISLAYTIVNGHVGKNSNGILGKNSDAFAPLFLPGPYTNSGSYTDVLNAQYNHSFYVSKALIKAHFDSLNFGKASYVAPNGIRNWPAHGISALGQAEKLAPFVDMNKNGVYEPYKGDYPSFYGDHCLFSITHDNPNISLNAGVEMHSYVYWFDADSAETFENSVFQKTLYFSRVHDFDTFQVATLADFDLGNYSDDYIGTHVELGLVYAYNGDPVDEPSAGLPGFGLNIPTAGVMVLKGAKMSRDELDNPEGVQENGSVNGYGFEDGKVDNECYGLERSYVFSSSTPGANNDPDSLSDWLHYLSGTFLNGDTLRFGGYGGYGVGSTSLKAKYVYPGSSDTLHYGTNGIDPGFIWSEMTNGNLTGDRRFLMTSGSQRLYKTDTLVYDIVFVYERGDGDTTDQFENMNNLFKKCTTIKNAFNKQGEKNSVFHSVQENLVILELVAADVIVYPNPTTNRFAIKGIQSSNAMVSVFDINGRLLQNTEINATQNTVSLEELSGSVFIVKIQDGTMNYTKRVVKY